MSRHTTVPVRLYLSCDKALSSRAPLPATILYHLGSFILHLPISYLVGFWGDDLSGTKYGWDRSKLDRSHQFWDFEWSSHQNPTRLELPPPMLASRQFSGNSPKQQFQLCLFPVNIDLEFLI